MKLVALIFVCCGLHAAAALVVEYTAQNDLTGDGRIFRAYLIMETERKAFIEMMDDAAKLDSRFRYVTEEHNEFGHYVIAVNGVYESVEDQQYWAFMKIENGEKCLMQTGISTYFPSEGDHMLLELVSWDYTAPSC